MRIRGWGYLFLLSFFHPLVGNGWRTFSDYNQIMSLCSCNDKLYLGSLSAVIEMDTLGNYRVFDNIDGLVGQEIRSLVFDSLGRVWYGGGNGGFGFIQSGRCSGFFDFMRAGFGINAMAIFGSQIWVATDKGVSLFIMREGIMVGEIKESYLKLGGFARESPVYGIAIIGDSVFAGTSEGIAVAPRDYIAHNLVDPESWRTIRTGFAVNGFFEKNDTIYVLTANGIYIYVGDSISYRGLEGYSVKGAIDFHDTLFIAGASGVFKKFGNSYARVTVRVFPSQSASDIVLFNGVPHSGHAKAGYARYENGVMVAKRLNSPMGQNFVSFAIDSTRRVWVAGRNWGLSVFDRTGWRCGTTLIFDFTAFEDLVYFPDTIISAYKLKADLQGKIWCGTYGNGAFVLRDLDNYVRLDETNSPLEPAVMPHYVVVSAIDVDGAGNVWLANYNAPSVGLVVYPGGDLTREPVVFRKTGSGLTSNLIYALASSGTTLWIGLKDGGLIKLEHRGTLENLQDDVWTHFTTAEGLPTNTVNALVFGLDGKLYIGTDGGLARLDPQANYYIEPVQIHANFPLSVSSLAVDRYGALWVGSSDGVAVRLPSANNFTLLRSTHDFSADFYERSGLMSNVVYSIFADTSSNKIWFGLEGGISCLSSDVSENGEMTNIKVYPNPFRLVYGEGRRVTISGVPSNAIVRIFTPSGQLVREFPQGSSGYEAKIIWDGTNASGELVASGIYIAQIISPDGKKKSVKFGVVR